MEINLEQTPSSIFSKNHSNTQEYITSHNFHNGAYRFCSLNDNIWLNMYMFKSNLQTDNPFNEEYMKYCHKIQWEIRAKIT